MLLLSMVNGTVRVRLVDIIRDWWCETEKKGNNLQRYVNYTWQGLHLKHDFVDLRQDRGV